VNINRRFLTIATLALAVTPAIAATDDDDAAVAKALEEFHSAYTAADAQRLSALCAPELSYSHSDAHVEDKATFVTNATNSKILSLNYEDQTIRVIGWRSYASMRSGAARARTGRSATSIWPS
jgi:hypothetical protein